MNAHPPGPAGPALDVAADPPETGPGLAELLARARRLAAEPGLVDRLVAQPDQREWLPLDADSGVRAWLIAWPPGTGTGWHDHGGAAGAMVAVAGELTERSVDTPAGHVYGEPVRLPGGVGAVRKLPAGSGRAFGGRHIHEVTNEGPVTAYSVHVYAPDLSVMRHYAATGERLVFVGWETEQDW